MVTPGSLAAGGQKRRVSATPGGGQAAGAAWRIRFQGNRSWVRPDGKASDLKRGSIVLQGIEPFRSQESKVWLAHQPADIVANSVERDDRFRFDSAQQGLFVHQIVVGHGGGVGRQAKGAADQADSKKHQFPAHPFHDKLRPGSPVDG